MKRSVKLVFSTNALFLLFSIVTSLLSAWALKPEGRGNLTVITMWTFVFSHIGTFGIPYAHRYWAAYNPDWNRKIFTNTLIFTVLSGLAMIGLAWVITPLLTGDKSSEVIWLAQLFAINIPIILLNEMLRGQLEGARLFGWLGFARLSFIGTQAIGNFAFYVLGILTLENAILIIVVGQVVCAFFMIRGLWHELKPRWDFDWNVFRQEISYGLRSYPGILTEITVWRLDQMMLAIFASSTVVGLYTVAVAIAEITATLASSVADALMPEVASSTNAEESALLVGKTLRLTLYAQFLALIPLWISAPLILRFIYGEGFVEAAGTMRLLLLASIIWSAAMIVISGLNGLGHPGFSTVARLFSGVTTVVTLFYLLPSYGMNGAAISSLLGYSTMLIVAVFCLLRKQNISFWNFMRPRPDDISFEKIKSFLNFSPPIPENVKT
jgi:O-antigen/teichoic acid export membrane protein